MSNKTGWLLDRVSLGADLASLAEGIRKAGFECQIADRPNPPYGWDDVDSNFLDLFPVDSCVVVSGDLDMVERVRDADIWHPGVFADIEKYFCTAYYPELGRYLLNSNYVMLPLGEISRRRDFLFETVGQADRLFIRPDSPLKTFTGDVVSRDSLDHDLEYFAFRDAGPDHLVVVSTPAEIQSEWRFIVVDGQVITGSLYKREDDLVAEPVNDGEAFSYAQSVCNETGYSPERVWVLDICQTTNGMFHVLEVGGFSLAGLYACDKLKIAIEVSRVAEEIHSQRTGNWSE